MNNSLKAGILFKCFAFVVVVALAALLVRGLKFTFIKSRQVKSENFTCPKDEQFIVVSPCAACTAYQMKHKDVCKKTGYIEKLKCPSADKILSKSCPLSPVQEAKTFWIFEASMVSLSLLSNLLVWFRRRSNNAYMYHRLKRQISDVRENETGV